MNITKKHILSHFKQQEGAIPFDALLRALGGRHIKRELKNMLEDMAEEGELIRLKGNSYSLPGKMKTTRGRISVHRDGYGFVTPEGGGRGYFYSVKISEERPAWRSGGGEFKPEPHGRQQARWPRYGGAGARHNPHRRPL